MTKVNDRTAVGTANMRTVAQGGEQQKREGEREERQRERKIAIKG